MHTYMHTYMIIYVPMFDFARIYECNMYTYMLMKFIYGNNNSFEFEIK